MKVAIFKHDAFGFNMLHDILLLEEVSLVKNVDLVLQPKQSCDFAVIFRPEKSRLGRNFRRRRRGQGRQRYCGRNRDVSEAKRISTCPSDRILHFDRSME